MAGTRLGVSRLGLFFFSDVSTLPFFPVLANSGWRKLRPGQVSIKDPLTPRHAIHPETLEPGLSKKTNYKFWSPSLTSD